LQVSPGKPTSEDDNQGSNENEEAENEDDIYCTDEDNLERNRGDSPMDLQQGDNVDFNVNEGFALPVDIDEASPSEDEAAALAALHHPQGLVFTI
jgi:hypothetical protein